MNNSATFGIFYTFIHSLPTVSVIFDLLALFLAYHFKNVRIFYIVLSFLILKIAHVIESIYQAHLIISLLLPFVYTVVFITDDKVISFKNCLVKVGFFAFVLIFIMVMSNITTFNSDISNTIFKSKLIYKFFNPISELSFVLFWFFGAIIVVYMFLYQLSIVYFIGYFLAFVQFLFYGASSAVSYYEFSSFCFIVYFMIISYKLMFYDQLTNILNRRAYERFYSKDYYLAISDIDYFKKFNDTYGHDVGDMVLKTVAKIMKKTCKKAKVYRLGGEEFVIIFDNMSKDYVEKTLENFRLTLSRHNIKIEKENVNITISIGVCKNLNTKDETLKMADNNLYKAKENGRNQIVW